MLEPSPVNIFLWDNFTHLDFLISFGTNVKTSQLKEVSVYVLIALIYCVFKNTEPGLPMHLCLDVKHPFPESLSLGNHLEHHMWVPIWSRATPYFPKKPVIFYLASIGSNFFVFLNYRLRFSRFFCFDLRRSFLVSFMLGVSLGWYNIAV